MIDRLEHAARRWRQRVSRSEGIIRRLGLPVSEDTGTEPGLLLIQIDGLARHQLERAMHRGRMPFLKRLLQRENYDLHTFYSGLPSTTPAAQGELFYGVRCAVPAFSFLDRSANRVATMYHPDWAKRVEARLRKQGDGLLRGGSSWSNIYTGGAAPEESHFCAASSGLGELMKPKSWIHFFSFLLWEVPAVLRLLGLLVMEFFLAIWDVIHGVARGENVFKELKFILSRVFVAIGLRELVTVGAKVDLARGLPVIHVNFLGYDEQAHRRGPSSAFAHWSLKGIDRAVRRLYRGAQRSTRRDYQVWVFSDHGQETTRPYEAHFPGGIEQAVAEGLRRLDRASAVKRARSQERDSRAVWAGGKRAQRSILARSITELLTETEAESFSVAAMGPVGHVYLATSISRREKKELAEWLVREKSVPGVIYKNESDEFEWVHSNGEHTLLADAGSILPHPTTLRKEVARDLAALCSHEHAGDLVLLGWNPKGPAWSFPCEKGAHAGLGPHETQAFALLPTKTPLPASSSEFLRPETVRTAALHFLGRQPISTRRIRATERSPSRLRVMTYNIHGCLGMDGRTSPSRIARVVQMYEPDIVALQEVDLGRARSRRHDQAAMIAKELGMQVCFCPTVVWGDEQYGHALLSRFPVEVRRIGTFEARKGLLGREPRGALWACLQLNGLALHVLNTHFGLGRRERADQVMALLGGNWLGAIDNKDALILCGDFNMRPETTAYRALTARLADVQSSAGMGRPLKTFSTLHPFSRIDHIFISPHFRTEKVLVPRNHVTRIASDHLPLIADLVFQKPA